MTSMTNGSVEPNGMGEPLLKSSPRGHTQLNVNDLPDLTERLQEQGVYDQYTQWRDSYMRWRKGDARGAKGENTIVAHTERAGGFAYWYPTVKTFNFRRTIAFWCAVCCIEGCLLFMWIPFFESFIQPVRPGLSYVLTKIPNMVGGCIFFTGIYLQYFELININTDVDITRPNFLWCDWNAILKVGIEAWSIASAVGYMCGGVLYTVSQVSDLFDLDEDLHANLVEWPVVIGGFFLFLSGFCELVINRVFSTPPITLVWWVALMNFIGGFTFWTSSCTSWLPGTSGVLVGLAGDVCFLLGALLTLLMWRGDMFGGAVIPALNAASRDNRSSALTVRVDKTTGITHIVAVAPAVETGKVSDEGLKAVLQPKLSARSTAFIMVYIVIAFMQIVVCCACCHNMAMRTPFLSREFRTFFSIFVESACNVVIVHMVLVLQSACVKMPKEQPYHMLMIMLRVLSLVFLANTSLLAEVVVENDAD